MEADPEDSYDPEDGVSYEELPMVFCCPRHAGAREVKMETMQVHSDWLLARTEDCDWLIIADLENAGEDEDCVGGGGHLRQRGREPARRDQDLAWRAPGVQVGL